MVNIQELYGLSERLIVDTSEEQPSYLLITKSGKYIKLSSSAYNLLQLVNDGASFEEIAARLSAQQSRTVPPAEIEAAYQRVAQNIVTIEGKAKRNPSGFWFRVQLIPAAVVERISRYLSIAFHPLIAYPMLVALAAVIVFAVLGSDTLFAPIQPGDQRLISVLLLFLLSMVFHEFGHASACVRFGLKPSEIGFALYWIYPVFYSNVNAVWRLPRRQRVVVDLGGVYFQFIVGGVYLFLYLLTGWEVLRVSIVAILISCVFTLNPVLKFDGYWFVVDTMGVVNLWKQPPRIFNHFYNRWRGRPVTPLPWPPRITFYMTLYTVISIAFWCYFTVVVGEIIWRLLQTYPPLATQVFASITHPPYSYAPLIRLLDPTISLLAVTLTLIHLGRRLLRTIRTFTQQRAENAPGEPRALSNPQK